MILLMLLSSLSLFAGTFEDSLKGLDQCLKLQSDKVSKHMELSLARSRKVGAQLEKINKKYENQNSLTHVIGLLSSTLIQDVCAENPSSATTTVGKLKSYRKMSSDFTKIDNDLYDLKYISVNASFDVADHRSGKVNKQKLKENLQHASRKFDSALRKINYLAGKYQQSYQVHSCQKLADSL